ncbi:MAG TPA: nicotinate (nicotinamide) nucleotide adenylyltransferase [Cyclobacteriaceae bacterium]|jgi:nicotinate-nucleotide adenylyltransferase|nr:nicotinate-nucleotide adenylyltransferase [Cytophagales bacterium]HMR55760.1 nicotinate (nicotinamide) nucleotide adenylyltransferase [Cyclobacteriaceae bacterium]HRE67418.1 nicotinate (nicotinamide) nucleotide adenylyltransferase [Cyclobacteriaceae bacterium]HRF33441.1 nicotinate (nicotinamide) nucleotide adenylyltransferase [Cyclobacteriaceae bacterium]
MDKPQKIGLFFGSFNPIHMGHLIIANIMAENTDLNKVWFVVSPQNPLKPSKGLLHEFDRYDMVKVAIADNFKLEVSDVEFNLPKPSYTIHTLAYLNEKHPAKQFKLIVGGDNLENFTKWKNHEEILNQYGLYVYRRPGVTYTDLERHPNVKMIDAPLLDISATYIRNCLKNNKSIRYLVPEAVEQLIRLKNFYQ